MVHKRLSLLLIVILSFALVACRSGRRGTIVGDEPISLTVEMIDVLERDKGNKEWIYELSGCVNTTNGELGENNEVTFKSPAFRKGMGCQLRVKTAAPSANIAFLPGEENVLYWSKEVVIGTGVNGEFRALAVVQRLYDRKAPDASGAFAMRIDVAFPAAETGAPITATLNCTPAIPNVGAYTAKDSQTGWFKFNVAITDPTAYQCSTLWVGVEGFGQKYKADLANAAFEASSGADLKVGDVVALVELQPPPPPGDVGIETTGEACNKRGRSYDTATRTCVDAE